MLGACIRGVSLRSLLHQSVARCRTESVAGCRTESVAGVRHSSSGSVTVLHEGDVGKQGVRITLADNPGIIVCHHPPKKVKYELTRPLRPTPQNQHPITPEQRDVALKLMTDQPLVWGTAAIAQLFNVRVESVWEIEIPRGVLNKRRVFKALLKTWSERDQTAFKSYISNSQYETRNQILAESPHLFGFCEFNREEELAKIKLYGLKSEFPEVPQIVDL